MLLLTLSACAGPPASDAEVCRDVIHRLCLGPVCETAATKLQLADAGCEATLVSRTGCANDQFSFETPTRTRVLECRVPLVRESTSREVKASCDLVAESFNNCPELVRFLGGTP